MWWRGFLALLLFGACIRSPAEVEPPGEGGFISGTVIVRDALSGELLGASGVEATIVELNQTSLTDSLGRFQFDRVPLGPWRIRLSQRQRIGPPRTRFIGPVEILVPGQTVALGQLPLQDNGGLQGAVRLSDADDTEALGGTLVVLAETAFKAVTNDLGAYVFPQLPEGQFSVAAFRSGYAPGQLQVDVRPTTIQFAQDLVLVPGDLPTRTVSGDVRWPEGEGPTDVQVELANAQDPTILLTTTVDADGRYTFDEVPVGVYALRIMAEGYIATIIDGIAVLPEVVLGLRTVVLRPSPPSDIDGDGVPDAEDDDRDGDGCPNGMDGAPDNPLVCGDLDQDGIDDLLDNDDDNDGLDDAEEESPGTDGVLTDPRRADTDGDGIIDGADVCPTSPINDPNGCPTEPVGPPPVITELRPATGRAGETLAILGRNFIPTPSTLVQFGEGAIVRAATSSVTSRQIVVPIPANAQSGPVTVVNADRVVTSSDAFTFLPPPDPVSFQPTQGPPGTFVTLFGLHLGGLRQVLFRTIEAPVETCPSGTAPPAGQTAVCFRVPDGAVSSRITVVTDDGEGASRSTFVIPAGPRITEFVPAVVPPGATVEIVGRGFSGPDQVTVRFEGPATATSIGLTDSVVRVVVPAAATTGAVVVEHPGGDAVSPDPLEIIPLTPVVTRVFPTIVTPGDTLLFEGLNLQDADEVVFAGNLRAMPATAINSRVTVTVPAGVAPGPVRLVMNDGTPVVAPRDLHVMSEQVVEVSALGPTDPIPGVGIDAAQTELYFISSSRQLVTVDINTLAATTSELPINLTPYSTISSMVGDPAGRRILLNYSGPSRSGIVEVEPGTFLQRTFCDGELTANADTLFFANDSYLVSNTRLVRFDFTLGTCSRLIPTTPVGGIIYAGQGFLYVVFNNQAVVDIDPTRSTFGQIVEPLIGRIPGSWSTTSAYFGPGNEIYIAPLNQAMYRMLRRDPSNDFNTLDTPDTRGRSVRSTNRRWAMAADESATDDYIFDIALGESARESLLGRSDSAIALPYANGSRFIIYRSQPNPSLAVITIDEAP